MAEFYDVARAYIRMCDSFGSVCNGCPIEVHGNGIYACRNRVLKDPQKYETDIMSWAAKHPVYPTWIEWLMSEGVILTNYMAANSTDSRVRAGMFYVTSKAFEPISADMAQKQGIEPKEG